MKRSLAVFVLLVAALPAPAHFVFLAPHQGKVRMVFSEDTEPDAAVPIAKIAQTQVQIRAGGKPVDAPKTAAADHYLIALPGKGPVEVGAVCEYGVLAKSAEPFLLCYYAKTLVGGVRAEGMGHPLEIFPVAGKTGAFEVRWKNKPAAGLEVVVDAPEQDTKKLKTGADGTVVLTALPKSGLLALRAKHVEALKGERDGKAFSEVRHYATLVVPLEAGR
jgi:hypothetical protein